MSRRAAVALAVLCVAQFVEVLGVTVAIVALPSIGDDLDAGATATQWVVTTYALTFGGLLLAGGRAADVLGRRRVFIAGLAGFGAASLVCGLAPSIEVLLAARAVQGVAAAAVVPAALALLTATFDQPDLRTRAVAVWTAAAAGGGAAGFLVGGVVTGGLGWRWVFLLNLPVVLAAVGVTPFVLDERRPPKQARVGDGAAGAEQPRVRDGAPGAERPRVGGGATAVERARAVLGGGVAAAAAVAFVLTFTTGGSAVLVTSHLQDVLGHSPAVTGLLFLPFSVVVAVASMLGPRVVERAGRRGAVTLGLLGVAAGIAACLLAAPDRGAVPIVAGLVISAAGLGWASVAATEIGMASASDAAQGLAAGVLNTATQLGTAAGTALIGGLAGAVTAASDARTNEALVDGFHAGWLAGAAIAAAAAVGTLAARRRPAHRRARSASVSGR